MEFLTSAQAADRAHNLLFASLLLWLGAAMAWLMRADAALLHYFDTSRFFGSLRPVFEWYTDWGLFVFYAFFIGLLAYGVRNKRPLFKFAGLSYVYAQVFGTLLLVRLIKIGCGRPRPQVASAHDVVCQVPSLAHAFNSFPSSHAANVAVGATLILLLLRSRVVALLALAAALFMALSRIAIVEHYLSDVLAGLAVGMTVAWVVTRVYLLPRWRAIETTATR